MKRKQNTLFNYINQYGNLSFDEEKLNEVDLLIFSQFPYLNLQKSNFNKNKPINLFELSQELLFQDNKCGYAQIKSYELLLQLRNMDRYNNILFIEKSYKFGSLLQFGAVTIKIDDKTKIVCFEGTDTSLEGWKEDFSLSYIYPSNSQKEAIKYLSEAIEENDENIYVCGHSKGGNLSLVAAMNIEQDKKNKIVNVYSFDGPGLKEEEFNSVEYQSIKDKLINIIPNYSFIGVLLKQENVRVIKSNGFGFMQHEVAYWQVDELSLKNAKQSNLSKNLDNSINNWLLKHDFQERQMIVDSIFNYMSSLGYENFSQLKENVIIAIYKIISNMNTISNETKMVLKDSLKLLFNQIGDTLKENRKQKFKKFTKKKSK